MVFYRLGSGVITKLEKFMPKIIGQQQKAYFTERNIGSILLNLLNMMDHVNQKKKETHVMLIASPPSSSTAP
jgi:hypothetical protein